MLSVAKIMNGNVSYSTYLVDSYDVWHVRLERGSSGYIKKNVISRPYK